MKRAATNPDFEDEIYMEYVELKKQLFKILRRLLSLNCEGVTSREVSLISDEYMMTER
jgi:hypothetical protein